MSQVKLRAKETRKPAPPDEMEVPDFPKMEQAARGLHFDIGVG